MEQLCCDYATTRDPHSLIGESRDWLTELLDTRLTLPQRRKTTTTTTTTDGASNSPMRSAEAGLTLGVVAARSGDLDQAVSHGHEALAINRRSQPSLLMIGKELDDVLHQR